jgi:hypothetical protein
MKKTRMLIYPLFVTLALLAGCKKESPAPAPPKTYQMLYRFVNLSKTDYIGGVAVKGNTYYPDSNKTWFQEHAFPRNLKPPVLYGDTFTVVAPRKVYMGCLRQMAITLGIDSGFNNHFRYFYFERDTIDRLQDTLMYFRWPQDTANAIETLKTDYYDNKDLFSCCDIPGHWLQERISGAGTA